MLALRSVLVIAGDDEAAYAAAASAAADAVLFDLAEPGSQRQRAAARRLVEQYAPLTASARRTVVVRIGDTRSGELEADVDAVVMAAISAVVLPGADLPQDVRDADVAIRKREMRRGVPPGSLRLIPELDSAGGLRALPSILEAVDRHGAVAIRVGDLLDHAGAGGSLGAPANGTAHATLAEHAMAEVAIGAAAAGLPWIVTGRDATAMATRARDLGATGVAVASDAEARGMNALFAPDPEDIAAARAMLAEWERVRGRGRWLGAVDVAGGARVVDRRSVRHARTLVGRADAIERRAAAR
ncbi:MAG: aldolase/citrate lyase family protein [Dehalococcoidia bacterium]